MRYDGVTGIDKPLLADPTPPGSSQLPAGVVQINRENYMLVTTVQDLVPADVAAGESRSGARQLADGAELAARRPATQGGRQSQISGYYDPIPKPDSPSGWVYIVANNFDRSGPAVLYRAKPRDLHRPGQLAGLVVAARTGGGASRRRRCGRTGSAR